MVEAEDPWEAGGTYTRQAIEEFRGPLGASNGHTHSATEPEPAGAKVGECIQCGSPLHRHDQKYCSSACRSRYRRAQPDVSVTIADLGDSPRPSPAQHMGVTSEPEPAVRELALRSVENPFARWQVLAQTLPPDWRAELSRSAITITWE
jgi:hypothetical protein